jgi:hypothetical protein
MPSNGDLVHTSKTGDVRQAQRGTPGVKTAEVNICMMPELKVAAVKAAALDQRTLSSLRVGRKAHERNSRATETRLRGWACRIRTQESVSEPCI